MVSVDCLCAYKLIPEHRVAIYACQLVQSGVVHTALCVSVTSITVPN